MKKSKLIVIIALVFVLTMSLGTTAFAAPGDVAGAIEDTWGTAQTQIKAVVNNVVFPVLDLILAVFFFVKLGSAYFDCAPVTAM